jgi:hypothetical protein
MDTDTLLQILIASHSLIAVLSTASLCYLYYAAYRGLSPARDGLLAIALIWPLLNLVILATHGWVCPMQEWAEDLAGRHGHWVRDMYWLPESWLRLVPWTYGPFYAVGAALVFARLWLKKRRAAPCPPPHQASR